MAPPARFAVARLLLRRLLSTVSEAAAEAPAPTAAATASGVAAPTAAAKKPARKDPRLLYRRLSALGGGAGEGSVSKELNKWVREGGAPRSQELISHVKELRKYKRHAHALEVYPLPPPCLPTRRVPFDLSSR